MEFQMIAKTFLGLEEVLASELVALGARNIQIERRAVSFSGNTELLYKANLCCRCASRILKPIAGFEANSPDQLYRKAKKIAWEDLLTTEQSFAIDATVYSEHFNHSKFAAYRLKDAIADRFNEKYGKRPSVHIEAPDIRINLHISQQHCTLSLDSSGSSLHKRGYRTGQGEAPLNEALAAGMLLMAGWQGQTDFVDPMCGSGTLLIEAALIALNIPPGIFRNEFAFEKWKDFDKELFEQLYNDDSQERSFSGKIYGSDVSGTVLKTALRNIKSAGLDRYIQLSKASVEDLEAPTENCLIVTNPPYGERIVPEDLFGLYASLGSLFKHRFAGSTAWVISSHKECLAQIGLKPSRKIRLMNGALDCSYNRYDLFAGKHKQHLASRPSGQ